MRKGILLNFYKIISFHLSFFFFFCSFGPNRDMSKMIQDYRYHQEEHVEEVPITTTRIWWVRFVWLMTFWIPTPFLRWFGKMKREDVQMAWREKVTICLLIFLFSGITIFFIVGLSPILCPGTSTLYSTTDVGNHNLQNDFYVSIAGQVWDLTSWIPGGVGHGGSAYPTAASDMAVLAGLDISYTFPPPMTQACPGLVTSDAVKVTPNASIVLGPFIHTSGSQQLVPTLTGLTNEQWYFQSFLPEFNKDYRKGSLVHLISTLNSDFNSWSRMAGVINGKVYDITDYLSTAAAMPTGVAGVPNYHYLDSTVEQIFQKYGGGDMTDAWNKYTATMNETYRAQNLNCLNNAFYIGGVDYRYDLRCTFTNYLLLAFALLMCLTILVKFLAALQFGGKPTPEDHDKFVICQVPCYTEGEESIKKTIDSLTAMTYDDKRKLLFIIADGMIMGSGNDRPTPRIVLDVLGHDPKLDPEPLMFKSIGEGSKQLNYGKVYSGLYEFEGHVVPYIVVVKVGKASERSKPGNRGKRDSQIICMNFLNKVHFEGEMTPLELEIYHQMKNVIGVNPSFYEYVLMVDSDTEVEPDALTRLISCMLHDGRIIGLCGETKLVNEDRSWTTMIQVYEYYISHHLSKAFESLFGSVTCLPGCFCMYRIRTPTKNTPLIISPKVIKEYSDNHVDTLHKKNLLHLGEDRYLTTLMMKHFPQYKMKFTPHAQCKTVAPDAWKILLSQRRRWINSTVHNFLELVFLPELCGFCCFSMRFVVILDLIGTMTLPVSVVYLVYLIYVIASGSGPFPEIALIMLGGIYALQAIIFILKRQWQYIGWMIIYILAIPIFSFFIPLYSFWHFDDFSWGNTRVVIGDNKKKQIFVADDEKFDDKMIPLKKWSVYEQELWEMGSSRSGETGVTGQSYRSHPTLYSRGPAGTVYSSQHGSQENFDYYRDTKLNVEKPRGRSRSPIAPPHGGSRYAGSVMHEGSVYGDYTAPHMSSRAYSVNQDYEQQAAMMRTGRMTPTAMSEYEMTPSRPMSQYSMPMSTMSLSNSNTVPGFPRDEEIVAEIKNILATANLMSITKKQGTIS
jgi:chitin synthase